MLDAVIGLITAIDSTIMTIIGHRCRTRLTALGDVALLDTVTEKTIVTDLVTGDMFDAIFDFITGVDGTIEIIIAIGIVKAVVVGQLMGWRPLLEDGGGKLHRIYFRRSAAHQFDTV